VPAGKYDQLITIQSMSTSRDATYNQVIRTWADLVALTAEVRFFSPSAPEPVVVGQQQSTLRARFRLRYYPGIDSTMRISYDGKYYQILDVSVNGRREELVLNAVEWNEGRR
jgi:SPP1 family predicted phage head-tail adaptor